MPGVFSARHSINLCITACDRKAIPSSSQPSEAKGLHDRPLQSEPPKQQGD